MDSQQNEDDELTELLTEEYNPELDLVESGVCHRLLLQDPTITTVGAHFHLFSDRIDKASSIGNSRHVRELSFTLSNGYGFGEVMRFTKALATNRSIVKFELGIFVYGGLGGCKLFENLLPFFESNTQCTQLRFLYKDSQIISESLIKAFAASSSLSRVKINKLGSDSDDDITALEEKLISTLISRNQLRQLSMKGNLIGKNGSIDIAKMLANTRTLKSLSLLDTGDDLNPTIIAKGLSKNNSVAHFAYNGKDPHMFLQLKSINFALKRLDLSSSSYGENHVIGQSLSVALVRFYALTSLDLSKCTFNSGALCAIFKIALRPISKLENLMLCDCNGLNDTSLRVLGSCIANNESLKSLRLSNVPSVTSDAWSSFFSRLHGSIARLEDLNLAENVSIDDSVLPNILCLLIPGSKIKSFNIDGCEISDSGWDSLMNVLHLSSIDQLIVKAEYYFTSLTLPDNLYRLLANGNLKKLALFFIPIELCESIMNVLSKPLCQLEDLSFWCEIYTPEELLDFSTECAEALRSNATLNEWHIDFIVEFLPVLEIRQMWSKFINILCAKDTIDSTYNSNHTISHLDFIFRMEDDDLTIMAEDEMPLELYSLLQLNRNRNKLAVARRKVLNTHFVGSSSVQKLLDLNFILAEWPTLLSWVGKEESELSMMYGLLSSMPSLLRRGPSETDRKRKRC